MSSPTPPAALAGPAPRQDTTGDTGDKEPRPATCHAGDTRGGGTRGGDTRGGDTRGGDTQGGGTQGGGTQGGDTQGGGTRGGHATPEVPQPGTRTLWCPSPRGAGGTGVAVLLEATGQFDMWRDYLGLAALVALLLREPAGLGDSSVTMGALAPWDGSAPCAGPAPHVGSAPPAGLAPSSEPAPRTGLAPCSFCQHNGEAPAVYRSHSLRDAQGRLQCPVLRSYVCPQCGATQDQAHTRRFCPRTHRGYTSVYSRPAGRRERSGRM
ncbi:nanos homolog 1-like [Serinus canaria]|uniref:nanos homolog 1-like n=1 Tax=Serinus canaria TaxID=9135 RepID=UPI0021CC8CEC|nr:nanos homolog 1-like [Serinus canaria]